MTGSVAVITPVYGNRDTLGELVRRLDAALVGREWRLRIVVDASPDDSLAVALSLAAADDRLAVTALATNVGQNRALVRGLTDEVGATAWVCLDADLQDPPEAIPKLLDRLAAGDVGAVFAGRCGTYEGRARLATGRIHRRILGTITGLPPDAGAFVALGREARAAVVGSGAPSIVAAVGASGVAAVSVPVERSARTAGRSAWTASARLAQSGRTLGWAVRERGQRAGSAQRCTTSSE